MEGSFYGIHDTSETLINIAKALGDPDLLERTLAYVQMKEDETRKIIAGYKKLLENKQAILFTGGVKTWSMVSTLAELGINILAGGTQNSTPEDFQRMKALMDPTAQIIEDTSPAGFLKIIAERKPALIVAGGKTKLYRLDAGRLSTYGRGSAYNTCWASHHDVGTILFR